MIISVFLYSDELLFYDQLCLVILRLRRKLFVLKLEHDDVSNGLCGCEYAMRFLFWKGCSVKGGN